MVAPVPAQITTLRLHPRAAAPRRPLLTTHHSLRTLFLLPVATGVYSRHSRRQTFTCSGMPTLLFASTCRLLALSLHSFLHSLPLFSIACSLFSENTRGGVTSSRSIVPRNPGFMAASISLRINTCKSVSKQTTLTPFRMNTCEKRGEGGYLYTSAMRSTRRQKDYQNRVSSTNPRYNRAAQLGGEGS